MSSRGGKAVEVIESCAIIQRNFLPSLCLSLFHRISREVPFPETRARMMHYISRFYLKRYCPHLVYLSHNIGEKYCQRRANTESKYYIINIMVRISGFLQQHTVSALLKYDSVNYILEGIFLSWSLSIEMISENGIISHGEASIVSAPSENSLSINLQ